MTTTPNLQAITRLEIIDSTGRAYTAHNARDVTAVIQDDDHTLKIFATTTATPHTDTTAAGQIADILEQMDGLDCETQARAIQRHLADALDKIERLGAENANLTVRVETAEKRPPMRDPKTHAKVLELRLQAVRSEWVAATAAHSNKISRLWGLFNRLIALTNRHEAATRWMYRPPEGDEPGKWVYTELDTEEDA